MIMTQLMTKIAAVWGGLATLMLVVILSSGYLTEQRQDMQIKFVEYEREAYVDNTQDIREHIESSIQEVSRDIERVENDQYMESYLKNKIIGQLETQLEAMIEVLDSVTPYKQMNYKSHECNKNNRKVIYQKKQFNHFTDEFNMI